MTSDEYWAVLRGWGYVLFARTSETNCLVQNSEGDIKIVPAPEKMSPEERIAVLSKLKESFGIIEN